jgi:hypothetical protein
VSINRSHLLLRFVESYSSDPQVYLLSCGHMASLAERQAWSAASFGWCFCQVCAASPHPRTNPKGWAEMPAALARWRRREVAAVDAEQIVRRAA